jgi:hypothetical protein
VAVDAFGCAYVTGLTKSTNFPVSAGAFQSSLRGNSDALVAKFTYNQIANTLVKDYASYLGDWYDDVGAGIALDNRGSAFVTGGTELNIGPNTHISDAFVVKLKDAGHTPLDLLLLGN